MHLQHKVQCDPLCAAKPGVGGFVLDLFCASQGDSHLISKHLSRDSDF